MSANYSGAGFSDMYFNADAVAAERFAEWVAATRNVGPMLDAQAYADLAKPSQAVAPFSYRAVTPRLFNDILTAGMQQDGSSQRANTASQRAEK
jgi:cytochrome o ubiquinol oxidase subunit 2